MIHAALLSLGFLSIYSSMFYPSFAVVLWLAFVLWLALAWMCEQANLVPWNSLGAITWFWHLAIMLYCIVLASHSRFVLLFFKSLLYTFTIQCTCDGLTFLQLLFYCYWVLSFGDIPNLILQLLFCCYSKNKNKKYRKIWNRMTASILKQDPNTKRLKWMRYLFWHGHTVCKFLGKSPLSSHKTTLKQQING